MIKKCKCFALILISLITLICCGCSRKNNQYILINNSDYPSFFDDYKIDKGNVFFYCHIYVENKSKKDESVKIIGDFDKDQKSGLLKKQQLVAYNCDDLKNSDFYLKPGINELNVVFIGEKGVYDRKADRDLPAITFQETDA